jgi:general secretion pathway protein A
MYKAFYGLRRNPFNANPDPNYLLCTGHIREALACLSYGVQKRKGFILLTGEVGTGKTTLLNRLLEWLRGQKVSTAFIFNPRLSVSEFFEYMMADFGLPSGSGHKSHYLQQLNQWLLGRYRVGSTAVLIIDEAQNLSFELLEEIRLLTNLETSTEKLLQIVLSGQPELEVMLRDARVRQLRQRITLRCRTHPITADEMHEYLGRRLRIAGANGLPIFAPEAITKLYEYSQGIPRVINLLAEHALINGFVDQQRPISAAVIDSVAREFELDEVPPTAPSEEMTRSENRGVVEALKLVAELRDQIARTGSSGRKHDL